MKLKLRLDNILIIHCIFLFINTLIFSYSYLTEVSEVRVGSLKYLLLSSVIWTVYSSKAYLKWTSAYLLFLFTMCIFLFNRVFLDIFGLYEFEFASRFGGFNLPLSTQEALLIYFILSIHLIHLGAILALIKNKNKYTTSIIDLRNTSWEKFGILLYIPAIISFSAKLAIQLKVISSQGYLAAYTTLKTISYPWWTAGSGTLLLIGYSLLIASSPTKKRFFLYSLFFLLAQFAVLLKGARGGFVITLMFIIWYYYKFYAPKDIKITKAALISLPIIILSQIIVVTRIGGDFEFVDLKETIILFFSQQGVSMLVPGYMIYYKDQFIREGLPYILSPLTNLGSFSPAQTHNTVEKYNMLGHDLSYFLSPTAYLNGEGIAGSFLGELYDLPIILIPPILCLLGYFIITYDYKVKSNRLFLLLSFPVIFQILKMPRGNLFPNINIILALIFVYLMLRLLTNRRKNVN